jgi:hypothetical protein
MLCKSVIDHVNAESELHTLVGTGPYKLPGVNPTDNSQHAVYPARAVDIQISGQITDAQVQQLASANGLCRPTSENHHFELGKVNNTTLSLGTTVVGDCPINLLITDPAGHRIGFDATTGQPINEVGGYSTYSGTNTEPQIIEVPPGDLIPGKYSISGTGTGSGAYAISILVSGEDPTDPIERQLVTGTASLGTPLTPIQPVDCLKATLQLTSVPIPGGLLLYWPTWATNCTLQTSPNLKNWSPASGVNASNLSLTVTNFLPGATFFRLSIPQ